MTENLKIPLMKTINVAAQMTGLAKYQVRKLVLNNKIKYVDELSGLHNLTRLNLESNQIR